MCRSGIPTRGGSAGRSIERADVIPDFRAPDSIRFGLAPIYTRFVDVWDAIDRLAGIVESGEHAELDAAMKRVT